MSRVCVFTYFPTRNLRDAILDFEDASLLGKVRFMYPPWAALPCLGMTLMTRWLAEFWRQIVLLEQFLIE